MRRPLFRLRTILDGAPSTLRGMAFMSLAALMLTGVNALIRDLSSDMHPFEIGFAGTWVVLRPEIADVDQSSLLVLGSATIFATAMVII